MLVKNLQQLSRTPTTSDLVGQAELRLVIRSGQHRGQRVRLMAAQSSIGSGPGCTLRAAMPGVAPLHCWLHNSGRMTSLQANGFEVIHNGRAVSHAIIQPGDTLRLGTLDLQVAECPHETIPLSPAPELSFGAGAALDAMETLVAMEASSQPDDVQTSKATARTTRDLQALRNERRIGHRRLKRALLQLREVQSRFQSLARREQDLLVANRSLNAFHTTEREELLARIAEHHQEGLNLSQQLASAEAKLRSERAESAKLLQTAQATAEELTQAQTTVAHLSQEASSKHESLQLASLEAEKAHADHEAYVKSAEKALNSIKQELARHLDEKVHLQSELIEREAHARSLEEQVIILQQQLTQQQMSAVEMPHAKHAGIDDLEIQLESERRKHEQEAAEFTAVRARLERELTCLAATVREFQAERIAMFDASSAGTEEEKEAQEFAQQELATMLHKRQAEQEEWTRVRTRFEQERSALQAQLQQMEQELARQKDAFATDATETQYEITQTLDAVKADLQDAAAQALSLKESLTAKEEQHRLDQANWEAQQQELYQERELLRDRWESTRQEINALRKDLATKEATIDALNLTQANLFEQLATQQTHSQLELSRLASQLRGAEARVNQTEAELEQRVAAEELEAVQAQLASVEQAQQVLVTEREILIAKLSAADTQLNDLRIELEARDIALEVANTQCARLYDQLASLETESQARLDTFAAELQTVRNYLSEKEAECEARILPEDYEAVRQQLQLQTSAVEELALERETLREQLAEFSIRVEAIQEQLVAKEAEAQLGSQHFALAEQHRATAEAIYTERNALQEQLLLKEQALEEANRLLEMETEERTEVEGHLHTERDSLREQVANLSQSIDNLQNALAAKDAELEEAKLALEQAYQDRCKAEELESANTLALREQMEVALTQIAQLQEQLVAKEAEVEAGSQHYASAEQYRSTAEELRAERNALAVQLTSISAQFTEFQSQLDQKAAEIQELNQQHLEAQEHIQLLATVQLERDSVGEELATMTAIVAELREQLLQKESAIEEANRLLEMETEERGEVEGRLHAEHDGLRQQVANLSQSIAELQGALATKEAELLAVKHSFDLSHQDRSKAEQRDGTEIQALREQMDSALTQIAELQQQLARKEAELDEASRRWGMAQEQLSHTQSLIQSEAERAQAELREFKANLIAQDQQLAQAIPPEAHAIIAQQLSQREDEIALLSQDQEKLCEQLLVAEQRVQELTDKLAAQDTKLEQAERSHQGEDQAIDTERLALRDEVARLKDALHLVEDQLATQAEQPEQLSLLTTEVETLRQLLADCQLEVQQLVTERCELHSTIEKLKDEQATVRETPEAMSAPIEQPAETPDRPIARAFEGSGFGRDEGRMAASAEDIRMSFAPFDWQAERERMLRAVSDEASQPIDDSASSTGATAPPEATEPPAAQSVDMPVAQDEVAQDVDSVLNRLMRAGVWKGSDALATSDSTSASSDSERKSEPSLSAPFVPREGFVTERFSPESFLANEETTEEEAIEEPSANLSANKLLSGSPAAQETEDDDASSVTPAPGYSHGRRVEDRAESVQPVASNPDNGTGDTDESIDSYMERLLSRVRGEGATECRLSSKPQKTTTSSRASQAPPDEAQAIRTTASTVDFVDHSEYIPRSQAPEQVSQLSALRELANTAARSALEQHAQKSRRTVSRDGNTAAIGLAVTGVLAGGVALYTGYWQAWAASGIALVASLLLGSKLLGDALRQLKLVSATSAQEAEAEASSKSEGEEPKQE